jgi:hypothetical protein
MVCEDWTGQRWSQRRQEEATIETLRPKCEQRQRISADYFKGGRSQGEPRASDSALSIKEKSGDWGWDLVVERLPGLQEAPWVSSPPLQRGGGEEEVEGGGGGQAAAPAHCPSCRLAKEDMQFQRLDGVDGPLGEAHSDFLQRLLPVGAGMAGGGLLGRRLSLLRRKNSCVSETSTAASCACASAPEGAAPECGCGDPLLDPGLREQEPEPPACPEPSAPNPGPAADPYTTVSIPGPRAPAPPWLPSPIGEEEESLA